MRVRRASTGVFIAFLAIEASTATNRTRAVKYGDAGLVAARARNGTDGVSGGTSRDRRVVSARGKGGQVAGGRAEEAKEARQISRAITWQLELQRRRLGDGAKGADGSGRCPCLSRRDPSLPGPRSLRPLRWLHIPKCGTSFGATIYHYGCPKIPPDARPDCFRGDCKASGIDVHTMSYSRAIILSAPARVLFAMRKEWV